MDNAEAAEPSAQAVDKKKTKKDKVRSAWISFAGRIVAQIVGAIATVALGVMVLHRYTSKDTPPPAPEFRHEASAQPGHPNAAAALGTAAAGLQSGQSAVHVIVITPAMLGLRDAGERLWPADRSCAPAIETPATSAAHLNNDTFLSR
jgi:hypothetical protein